MRYATHFLSREARRAALVLATFLAAPAVQAQVCAGNRTLSTQAEVDAFACTEVIGYLVIRSAPATDDIVNLDGLAGLVTVGGYLWIEYNDALTNVDGLAALDSIGSDLAVENNPALGACTAGLAPVLTADGVGGTVSIHTNAPGCNSVCEVLGTCPGTEDEGAPLATGLGPLRPNPARGDGSITYALAEPGVVTLAVYDMSGATSPRSTRASGPRARTRWRGRA